MSPKKRHKISAICAVCRRKCVTLRMVRSRKYLLGILTVCLMLPLFMRAQQSFEPTRTSFIIDGVAVDEDKLCSLDELSSDSARIVISRLFPDILPAYIAKIAVKPDSTDANSIVEIKTAPQRNFLILIDGEPYELEGMTFGIWLNENERGKYLQNFLNGRGLTADNIATANNLRYEDTHIGCNIPLPTIVLTTKHNTK